MYIFCLIYSMQLFYVQNKNKIKIELFSTCPDMVMFFHSTWEFTKRLVINPKTWVYLF